MASFLTRAFNMPASPDAGFTDVDATNTHYDNINALFASGVTVGCRTSPLQYCPARATTRAQMATFLWRAIRPAFSDKTFEREYEPLSNVAYNYALYDPTIGESTHVTVIYCSENPSYTDTSFNAHVSELQDEINDFLARESGTLTDGVTAQRRYEFSSGGVVSPSDLTWNPLSEWDFTEVKECLAEAGEEGNNYSLVIADVAPSFQECRGTLGIAFSYVGSDNPAGTVSVSEANYPGEECYGDEDPEKTPNYLGTIVHELAHAYDGFRHPWYDRPELCHNIQDMRMLNNRYISQTEIDRCIEEMAKVSKFDEGVAAEMLESLMSYTMFGASHDLDDAYIACYQKAKKDSFDDCQTESPAIVPDSSSSWMSLSPRASALAVSWGGFRADERAPVTDYDVQYRLAGDDNEPWTTWPHDGTVTDTEITGLRSNTLYEVGVRATNRIGSSAWLQNRTSTLDPGEIVVEAFIKVGDSAQGMQTDAGRCGAYCRWLHVELRDQNGNEINTGEHTLACAHDGIQQIGASGGVYRSAVVTDWPADRTCLFGYPGSEVFVIVDPELRDGVWYGGTYSNRVTWPDCVAEPQKCGDDDRAVRISWGSDASNRSDCPANTKCRNLNYEYIGDWPSPPYTTECWDNGQRGYGPFLWSGRPHTGCYYWGGPGQTAHVVIDGIRSNTITFPRT